MPSRGARAVAIVSPGVRTQRILLDQISVDGRPVEASYGDLFIVLREGASEVAWTDWEVNLQTEGREYVAAARHELRLQAPDGVEYHGTVIVRFSDGRRHLFRGDGELGGVTADSWLIEE